MIGYRYIGEDGAKKGLFIAIARPLSRYETYEWERVYAEPDGDAFAELTVANLDAIIEDFDLDVDSRAKKAEKAVAILVELSKVEGEG